MLKKCYIDLFNLISCNEISTLSTKPFKFTVRSRIALINFDIDEIFHYRIFLVEIIITINFS